MLVPMAHTQSISGASGFDEDYINSLPDSVKEDVLKEIENNENNNKNLSSRPSSKLSKLETVKDWEEFKKRNQLDKMSERYGLKIFNTMQSSFMPLNEPNFGNNYILDYGDIIEVNKYVSGRNEIFKLEIQRDGTILLPDLGSLLIGGLSYDKAIDLIKKNMKLLLLAQKYLLHWMKLETSMFLLQAT